ncbi:hypothetical protein CHGG_09838 [Chaetomium globosum CBS 148.51]|uniref:Peptidase A1 domain-containing protein n=1 Tax=Chaetomium globosum (strain ATCC 6205 / CBS 148.51 / DSM 1962 / NBRC 6347 / NRRL 1970) TaxID=306901 RepID=Q2GQB6_CHAGB|nr:uncharacterized protein CHGG_09838 [Chaetomium globosum CBS 148.51]EAQ83434.1 hypothetical protein CHGG_09838 [Chaetomium globosum CBS 148.51]
MYLETMSMQFATNIVDAQNHSIALIESASQISFGLHYGSAGATAKMPGSLLFGGYDRNCVIGPILSLDADFRNPVTL